MKKLHAGKKGLAFTLILAAAVSGAGWRAATAYASADAAAASVTMSGVTIAANSSYLTDGYAGVEHVSVNDGAVACASTDSENRVVVTGIGAGTTTVSFWYKTTWSADWVSASLPVTVSGVSGTPTSVDASAAGIVFAEKSAAVSAGSSYTPTGIRVNGVSEDASSLLWVTGSDSVVSVGKTSGCITALAAGTATVYAVDPATGACAALTVTVTA